MQSLTVMFTKKINIKNKCLCYNNNKENNIEHSLL